jgi:RNA recognition motif-containing protein
VIKIYVGNLSHRTTVKALELMFLRHGQVQDVSLAIDKETGKPRGFGFVFMPDENEARAAIRAINGTMVDGRSLKVSEGGKKPPKEGERPRGPRPSHRPQRISHRPRRGRPGGGGGGGGGGDRGGRGGP